MCGKFFKAGFLEFRRIIVVEIIETNNRITSLQQCPGEVIAYESGNAGYQMGHVRLTIHISSEIEENRLVFPLQTDVKSQVIAVIAIGFCHQCRGTLNRNARVRFTIREIHARMKCCIDPACKDHKGKKAAVRTINPKGKTASCRHPKEYVICKNLDYRIINRRALSIRYGTLNSVTGVFRLFANVCHFEASDSLIFRHEAYMDIRTCSLRGTFPKFCHLKDLPCDFQTGSANARATLCRNGMPACPSARLPQGHTRRLMPVSHPDRAASRQSDRGE